MEACLGRTARGVLAVALVLGAIHAVVDCVCVALLTREAGMAALANGETDFHLAGTTGWELYLVYGAIAFGAQFSIGAVVDRWGQYWAAALGALGVLAAGVLVGHAAPAAAIMLAGLGNALYHVGAGGLVMRFAPCRAAPAGVFVGPGAIGLAAGVWFSQACPDFWPAISLGLLLASAAATVALPAFRSASGADDVAGGKRPPIPGPTCPGARLAVVCLAALLFSIAIRSAAGLAVNHVHRDAAGVLWCLAIAACAGKMAGGFAADRFGWMSTSVAILLLSLPLLSTLVDDSLAAVAGIVLFQMTMPVTLMAVFRTVPREPGLAFGLASLALLLGAVPSFLLSGEWPHIHFVLLVLILLSVPALVIGLWPMTRP